MSKKKKALPFDKQGGVLAINRRMLNSDAYTTLKPYDKVLLLLLHEQWRNERPVAYSVREAEKKIPCNIKTAAGGVFITKSNDLSLYIVITTGNT